MRDRRNDFLSISALCRKYWSLVVNEIESSAFIRARKKRLRNLDYSITLPLSLRRRVEKIIPYEYSHYDKKVFMFDSASETEINYDDFVDTSEEEEEEKKLLKLKKKLKFKESSCTDISLMERQYPNYDLKMEKPVQRKQKAKKKVNWCSKYICKSRKERIIWDSKIYHLETHLWEKSLDEQAEILMDVAAERFTKWVNALGSNPETDISKDTIKALFSVEGDRKLLSAIQTEPKEIKAVAKTIADRWNLPKMALELKYENYIKNRLKNVPTSVRTVAFGETVPYKDRPWVPTTAGHLDRIKTIFPKDILTGEKLFKGIIHLRSVNALIDFCNTHPNVPLPKYLLDNTVSELKSRKVNSSYVPLYDKLKLVY